jgi:hypothetical protein
MKILQGTGSQLYHYHINRNHINRIDPHMVPLRYLSDLDVRIGGASHRQSLHLDHRQKH